MSAKVIATTVFGRQKLCTSVRSIHEIRGCPVYQMNKAICTGNLYVYICITKEIKHHFLKNNLCI